MPSKPSTLRAKAILGIPLGPHKPEDNGFGLCVHCGRQVHEVDRFGYRKAGYPEMTIGDIKQARPTAFYYRHNPIARLRPIHDNDRTHCSSCGRRFEAYELKPGDGRCVECAP